MKLGNIYREAAELIATGQASTLCIALFCVNCRHDEFKTATRIIVDMLMPDGALPGHPWFLGPPEENRQHRITALLLLAAMADSGDL